MAKNRTKIQRESDREAIAKMLLKHYTQLEIANRLEIDQSTVSRDIKVIQQRWRESSIRNFDLDRTQELDRINMLEREYWDAWQNSLQSKETTIREQLRNAIAQSEGDVQAGGGRVKLQTRVEQKNGDVAFLNGVLRCIELRSQILGLKMDVVAKSYELAAEHTANQINAFFEQITALDLPPDALEAIIEVAVSSNSSEGMATK